MENFKLNPPPSWPPFPVGWSPGPGWQPGSDLPPVPLGWQLWVPVDAREEAPVEIDLNDYIDPFAAFLPGATTINKAPVLVFADKPVFEEKRVKHAYVSTALVGLGLAIVGGYASYAAYQSGGWIHAGVTAAGVLAFATALTGLYIIVSGRPSWAQLEGGRGMGVRPLLLSILLGAGILAAGYFGLDVPWWVPEIALPK